MIQTKDKNTLYGILCVLEISLLTILLLQYEQLSRFDVVFIVSALVSHVILFISLWNQWCSIINILHFFLFFSIVLAIFIQNRYLQLLVILLVIFIQVMWIYKGRCIMNTNDDENQNFWGFSNELTVVTLVYTVILSIKFGRSF